LQEAEAELRRVLATVPYYLYSGEFDSNGRFFYHYVSPAVVRVLGQPSEFFLADSLRWLNAVHPEDRPHVAQVSAQLEAGQSSSEEQEYRVVLPDGAVRWVHDSVVVSQGTDGRRFVNGVVSDVTARRQAEEALRERELELRRVLDAASDYFWSGDIGPEGRFRYRYYSPAVERITGRPAEFYMAGPEQWMRTVHPEDRARLAEMSERQLSGQPASSENEHRIVLPDGTVRWVRSTVTVSQLADGYRRLDGVVSDITNRKRAEEALRESEERYRTLAESAADAIYIIDRDGCVQYLNTYAASLLESTPKELTGRRLAELFPPATSEDLHSEIEAVFKCGRPQRAQRKIRFARGELWLDRQLVPLSGAGGEVRAVMGISRDVTEHKRAEERLEERVRERTVELEEANAALRNSEAKYRALVEAIPAITYITSLDEAQTTMYVSPQAEQLLDLTSADYKANPHGFWLKHVHPDDRERVMAESRRGWTSHKPFDCEYRMLNRDGKIVWIHDRAIIICDRAGQPLYTQGLMVDVTERHQAEDTMRLQSTALESAANSIVITDREGLILWANQALAKLTGYELSEVIGKNLRILKSGQHDKAFYHNLWQTVLSGRVWHGEVVNKRKDGSVYTEDMTITPVRNAAGEITHFIAIKRDITESKLAEESRRRLAAIVESSDDAIVSGDLDGRITSWNAGAQRLYGYAPEEILERSIFVLIPPNRRAEAREILKGVQRGERTRHHETVRLRKGGFPLDVSITASPIKNDAGQVIGISAITHDITEQKRAAEALQKSEEQYRALVETTGTGFVILDRAGRVLDANAEYVRLTGHRGLDEIRGKSIAEWTAHVDQERNAGAVSTCLKKGDIRNLEIGYVDSHGKVTPVEVNATVDKTREALRIVALCHDITERKELERAVVEAASREQRRIGRDLHDGLCQQLTGIAFLWKTVEQSVATQAPPDAATVLEIGRLITKTIREARDLARGLCPVELEENELGLALKNLGSLMERLFAVSCVVQCRQPVLLADRTVATHLYRIAQEAVSNAIRHGKAARIWIYLGWKENKLTLRVRDNGSGFSQKRAFRQGIGIHSMRYRAKVIGASLNFDSKPSAGTTMTCVYPSPLRICRPGPSPHTGLVVRHSSLGG
jgi:PAS domain S-box-containing protein